MIKNKKAFTIIELVMIIVILGILSAVAIPKFVNLRSKAEIMAADSVRSEMSIQFSKFKSQWKSSGFPATVTVGSASIKFSNTGNIDISNHYNTDDSCKNLVQILTKAPSLIVTHSSGTCNVSADKWDSQIIKVHPDKIE